MSNCEQGGSGGSADGGGAEPQPSKDITEVLQEVV
jgi:hypothetical protein